MTLVTADMMISLDGYIAGPNDSLQNPGGDNAAILHEWIAQLASWRERQGLEGGLQNVDSEIIGEWFESSGAVVMGRNMYDYGVEFWGDNPPFRAAAFVLTHRPQPKQIKQGGTSFTFVSDGIVSALEQAKAVAGGKCVDISGGANTIQQYISAGLVDEMQLHVVPVLFGGGVRLFDQIGPNQKKLEPIRVVAGSSATHLKYRFVR